MKIACWLAMLLLTAPAAAVSLPDQIRGHWYLFETRWDGVSQIDVSFSMLVPTWRGGEESFFLLIDDGEGPTVWFLSSAAGPLTPRANVAGFKLGAESPDVRADAVGGRMDVHYRNVLAPSGTLRIIGFSLVDRTTFTSDASTIGGTLREGAAVGDTRMAVRTSDLDGVLVSTSLLTATVPGRTTFALERTFLGTAASHYDHLALVAPDGSRKDLPPHSSMAISAPQAGTWSLESTPAFRSGLYAQTVYVQGAFVPDLGVF